MHYEFGSRTRREDFQFPYSGKELLKAAIICRDKYRESEMVARQICSDLLKNPNVSHNDQRIKDAKDEIQKSGAQYEACCVYVRGFQREPERTFNLGLGDVVYFGLHEQQAEA